MNFTRRQAMQMIAGAVPAVAGRAHLPLRHRLVLRRKLEERRRLLSKRRRRRAQVRKFVFDGVSSEMQISMRSWADCAGGPRGYTHLVMADAMKFRRSGCFCGVHDAWAARSVDHRVWANAWLRASVPAAVFYRARLQGQRPASARTGGRIRRGTRCGAVRRLHSVESIGIAMEYPLNRPTIELRNVHLARRMKGRSSGDGAGAGQLSSNGRWRIGRERSRVRSS